MKHLKYSEEYEFDGMSKDLLDTYPAPQPGMEVTLSCSEVTTLCPITHQPDYHLIDITYQANEKCLESKSLKMYLNTFRQEGIMTEPLAVKLAQDLIDVLDPITLTVEITSASRGGISVNARVSV